MSRLWTATRRWLGASSITFGVCGVAVCHEHGVKRETADRAAPRRAVVSVGTVAFRMFDDLRYNRHNTYNRGIETPLGLPKPASIEKSAQIHACFLAVKWSTA
jgi:hypothetical protein